MMDTEFGVIAGDTEVVTIPYQKVYQLLSSDVFTQTSAWDGSVAWQSDDFQGTVELTGAEAASLRNQTVLDWFLAYQTSQFDDVEYTKYLNFTTTALALALGDAVASGNTYPNNEVFDFPQVNYTTGQVVDGGANQDITVPLDWKASKDPTEGIVMRYVHWAAA